MKTYVPKQGEVEKKFVVMDAAGKSVGRVATEAAKVLRGKHKPEYTPYLDCGDHVIIINVRKAVMTGRKYTDKQYYRHSGYPGGISQMSYAEMMKKHPTRAMSLAVKGMLPHNRLGRELFRKVRVYADDAHPHEAQKPEQYPLD